MMSNKASPIFLIESTATKATREMSTQENKPKKRIPCKHYKVTSDEERALLVQKILGKGLTIKEVRHSSFIS